MQRQNVNELTNSTAEVFFNLFLFSEVSVHCTVDELDEVNTGQLGSAYDEAGGSIQYSRKEAIGPEACIVIHIQNTRQMICVYCLEAE